MILNLQIKMILAENRQILLHQCLGFFFIILKDSARYLSCNAGGQTDDPFMILAQQFFIDTGLIIHPLNIGKRNQFDEIFIPRLIFRQKDQMIIFDPAGLLPILTRSRRQIHLTADNRFNSLLLALFIKINHTIHGTMIGNGNGIHPPLFDRCNQIFNAACSVQKAVFRMHMQVTERGFAAHLCNHFFHSSRISLTRIF